MQTQAMVGAGSWATLRSKGRWSELRNRVAAWARHSEPIDMCAQRYGYQPQRFRWHGALLRVSRLERVWERIGNGARNPRRYFRVLCQNDCSYTLYQDLRLGTWYVEV